MTPSKRTERVCDFLRNHKLKSNHNHCNCQENIQQNRYYVVNFFFVVLESCQRHLDLSPNGGFPSASHQVVEFISHDAHRAHGHLILRV